MKPYVITIGTVFGLLTLAHVWRAFLEPRILTDSWFVVITLAAAALCIWAWHLVWFSSPP